MNETNLSVTPGSVTVGWVNSNVIAKWHIEKLLRLKSLIEIEIVNRTLTRKHPTRPNLRTVNDCDKGLKT